ncbi:MAG: DoxX family protein [Balneola sp.]|nr:MAG: DoxX family protein [Balneola sp.]
MLSKFFKTTPSISPLIARITIGLVIFPHGAQKILGIWGGHGLTPVMKSFEQWFGIPFFITFLVAVAEFFGSIALILGFLSRFSAGSIIAVMLGAIYFVTGSHFFMNWYSEPGRGEGFELHLLVIGLCLIVLISGGGKYSIDGWIHSKLNTKEENE